MVPLSLVSPLMTVRYFVRPLKLREFSVFFLPVIRTTRLATGGSPASWVVPLPLPLLKGILGALSRIALLKVLFIRLSVSKIKEKADEADINLRVILVQRTTSQDLNSRKR